MELEKIASVEVSDLFGGLDPEVLDRIVKVAEASRLRGGVEHVMHLSNHLNSIGDQLYKNPPEDAPAHELSAVLDMLGGIIGIMDEYVENCVKDYNEVAAAVMYGVRGED